MLFFILDFEIFVNALYNDWHILLSRNYLYTLYGHSRKDCHDLLDKFPCLNLADFYIVFDSFTVISYKYTHIHAAYKYNRTLFQNRTIITNTNFKLTVNGFICSGEIQYGAKRFSRELE
jgi:hypothetical protein